jgi:hypothetical protein
VAGIASGNPQGVINGVSGAIQNAMLPVTPITGSAVSKMSNGFSEIQELHRFLLLYSRLKGAFPQKYSLRFRNFKTQQDWQCSLQDFSIQQNATNPHLYRYNIQLKCWDVKNTDAKAPGASGADRFQAGGDLASVNTLSFAQALAGFDKIGKKIPNDKQLGFG